MLSHRKHEKISVQEAFEIYSSNLTDFDQIVEFYKVNCDIFVIIVNRNQQKPTVIIFVNLFKSPTQFVILVNQL